MGFIKNCLNPRISLLAFVSSNSYINGNCYINRAVKIKAARIAAHTYIGAHTDVENAIIGKFCSIADNCRIGMSNHSFDYLSTSPVFTQKINGLHECWIDKNVFEHKSEVERVFVDNDIWIGSHVLIKGGVHIGNGACIAAGAVVVKDVPPYAIVGGVPAKVIRYRFPDDVIAKLEEIKWWDMPDEKLKEHIALFQKENVTVEELEKLK